MRRRIANLSLRKKYLLIICLCVLSISGICLSMMNYIIDVNNRLIYKNLASGLSYMSNELENTMSSIETLSDLIQSSSVLQDSLENLKNAEKDSAYSLNYRHCYEVLQNYYFTNHYINGIAIVQGNTTIRTSGFTDLNDLLSHQQTLVNESDSHNGANAWVTISGSHSYVVVARVIYQIKNLKLDNLGYLYIQVDIDRMLGDCAKMLTEHKDSSIQLFSQGMLLSQAGTPVGTSLWKHLTNEQPYQIVKIGPKKYFAVGYAIPKQEWEYICVVDYDDVFHSIRFAQILAFIAIGISAGLCVLFSELLVENINRHFYTLVKKMDAFQQNNMQLLTTDYDYTNRRDELGALQNHFDKMARKIKTLVEENYIKQLMLKEAQLKQLEQQINPHFLYNTLDSVNWQAKAIGAEKISTMVESLGNLLRASLSMSGEMVCLKRECELVQYYLNILQIRFEDSLCSTLSVSPDLYQYMVPGLILQPLVENAVKHSLEDTTCMCVVLIDARIQDEKLILSVKNSGSVFEENLLEKLYSQRNARDNPHIGMINVDARIKLLFGPVYGLKVFNENGMATVEINLPLTQGKEEE